jgi:hypothetical protein
VAARSLVFLITWRILTLLPNLKLSITAGMTAAHLALEKRG